MKYIRSNKKCLKNFFNFRGRASREEFWYYALSYFILFIIVTFASSGRPDTFFPILILVFFGIAFYSAGARRLHDINQSGLWQLVPIILNFFKDIRGMETEFIIAGMLAEVILFVAYAWPSQNLPNKYGKKTSKL